MGEIYGLCGTYNEDKDSENSISILVKTWYQMAYSNYLANESPICISWSQATIWREGLVLMSSSFSKTEETYDDSRL